MRRRAIPLMMVLALAPALRADDARRERARSLELARDLGDGELVKLLADADPSVRSAAARALGRIAAPGDDLAQSCSATVARALSAALDKEKDARTREELVLALGLAGTPESAAALARVIKSGAAVPERALAARSMGFVAEPDVKVLLQAIEIGSVGDDISDARTVAREAAWSVGVIARKAEAIAPVATMAREVLVEATVRLRGPSEASGFEPRPDHAPFTFALAALGDPHPAARKALATILHDSSGEDALAFAARGLAKSAKGEIVEQRPPAGLFRKDLPGHAAAEAARALGKHKKDPLARAQLAQLVKHPSFHCRRETALVLAEAPDASLGEEVAKSEIELLVRLAMRDPWETVRADALLALAKRDPARAFSVAGHLADDESVAARIAVASALPTIQRNAPVKIAEKARLRFDLLRADSDRRVRLAALSAVAEDKEDPAAVGLALSAIEDHDLAIRGTAVDILSERDDPRIERAFADAYESSRARRELFEVRESIIKALGEKKLGHATLARALEDPEPSVRLAAANALEKWDGKRPAVEAKVARRECPIAPWRRGQVQLRFETTRGSFDVDLFPREAPLHVANVVRLAAGGFYDGLTWHRVVTDFVVQGGDPRGDGWGDPGWTIPDEVSALPYQRGTLGMPKAGKDTGGCQLFFTHGRTPHLDGRYTVFGRISRGVDVLDLLEEGDSILKITVREPAL